MHYILEGQSLTTAIKELHLADCKHKSTAIFVHQYFLSAEVDVDADIPATSWLSTWWYCSNIYNLWIAYTWCVPDIKVIWHSIESQSGKASVTITVVVQRDGSQGDTCVEYKQDLCITTSNPPIMFTSLVLFLSKVRISQLKLCAITMDVLFLVNRTIWIPPTVGTSTLRSSDRVIPIGIL